MNFIKAIYYKTLDFVLLLMCMVTLTDFDLLKTCPKREKIAVAHTLLVFVLQLIFIFTLMYATLDIFLSSHAAQGLSALIAASVVLMEIKMISSIWTPQGILAEGFGLKGVVMLAARGAIAFILATAYAISVEIYIFGDDIDARAKHNNQLENAHLVEFYQQKLENKQSLLNDLESKIQRLDNRMESKKAEVQPLNSNLNALHLERIELKRLLEVEEKGLEGRPAGKQVKYWEYFNKLSSIEDQIALAEKEKEKLMAQLQPQLDELDNFKRRRDSLQDEIMAFDPNLLPASHPNFASYIPTGLAARYRLLSELKNDPIEGATVVQFSIIVKLVMMTLEMMPLLIKIFFTSASIYTEKLAEQTRISAAACRINTKNKINKLYSDAQTTSEATDTKMDLNQSKTSEPLDQKPQPSPADNSGTGNGPRQWAEIGHHRECITDTDSV